MRLSCLFCGNRCDNVGAIDFLKEVDKEAEVMERKYIRKVFFARALMLFCPVWWQRQRQS